MTNLLASRSLMSISSNRDQLALGVGLGFGVLTLVFLTLTYYRYLYWKRRQINEELWEACIEIEDDVSVEALDLDSINEFNNEIRMANLPVPNPVNLTNDQQSNNNISENDHHRKNYWVSVAMLLVTALSATASIVVPLVLKYT